MGTQRDKGTALRPVSPFERELLDNLIGIRQCLEKLNSQLDAAPIIRQMQIQMTPDQMAEFQRRMAIQTPGSLLKFPPTKADGMNG